jgi:hypothetical protein
MNGIRLAASIALACTIALPQAANAQFFGPAATVSGIVVLADSYPGDLRIACAKVVVTASDINSQPLASTTATVVPGTTRKCSWQLAGVPRMRELVFAANAVPVADYNTSTPTNVAASGKSAPVLLQFTGGIQPITLALVPSAPFPTAPANVLTIVSGNSQASQFDPRLTMGATASFIKPLVVKLTTTAGAPIAGVPVTFSCPAVIQCALQGGVVFAPGLYSQGKPSITVTTGTTGMATLGFVNGGVVTVVYPYTSEKSDGSISTAITATSGNQTATFSFTLTKQTTGLVGRD